jgi:Fe2+ or Zn2+ uptake regulation protein
LDKYVELLKKNNLTITPQRIMILKYLNTHKMHPTADEIYSSLKKNIPSLSKTTVYNSLDILKKYGLIQALSICGVEKRYDIKNDMHHHFLCKKCGRIIDINIKCPNINKTLEKGHKINEVHGYFKGICKNCLKKVKVKNG